MSIIGLTIDYGPFSFMDRYDPGHICNGSGIYRAPAFSSHPLLFVVVLQALGVRRLGYEADFSYVPCMIEVVVWTYIYVDQTMMCEY